MPLFTYVLGVGAVLLGLLFAASEFGGHSERVLFVTTDTLPAAGVKADKKTLPESRYASPVGANAFAYESAHEKVISGRDALAIDRNNHLHDSRALRTKAYRRHRHEMVQRGGHRGNGGPS